ncbi:branched-chain amino acid aminotransferase [Amniculicola lignicola CBS 123094]|uniref:Branched-chain amino acid aminotransferase n=1 Tax=Amniculicola lignicola CBS 123094 TaxID=1392246 RepID=A0A6A5W7B9_9PLEO|nr:branched-chain amino acid aminotransferase [Amniculicola lignicola CBS 123094]
MVTFPPAPTSALDWTNPADFKLPNVNGHIECKYDQATGEWSALQFVASPYIQVHGLSAGLNYGQQVFEGLKAFRMPGSPGSIAIFRPDRNAIRLNRSSSVLSMPMVPPDLFLRACRAAIALNAEYVPPHETGWGMYCRPLVFASGPTYAPEVPDECTFCAYVFPTPAGVQGVSADAVKALILDDFDRAAPKGIGHAKAGGNYSGVIRWSGEAKAQGYGITLHLDSARHEHIEEFSVCGFLGVKGSVSNGDDKITVVVPDTPCAIDSLTSDSVQHIARSWGWQVEKRPIPYKELPEFDEILGAGTAVGLTPIRSITRRIAAGQNGMLARSAKVVDDEDGGAETVVYVAQGERGGGPVFQKLLAELRAIQLGQTKDDFGWRFEVRASDGQI